ncbi:hypothetical protein PFICI_00401 [Pestalotiopsis fici W106-1]|uniref:Uncharacterized protein n=1 Tax=Pestalotiopsis fici (strain W106-1 / CGMCC3.15140) TaxID=1229662 RepID=W3XKI7_PESFW|nr:uncharacterized protein PFICI_00401 [Pestalotiopsis fici W106-1]ETS86573.1 hypothetical protein PFICI_00401 [Pestalotiopsis fici W106-1]
MNLPSMPQAKIHAGQVGAILEHLTRFRFARDLANDSSTDPFCESFDVRIRAGGIDVSPGNLLEVKDSISVEVVIRNKSEQPVFAFIYNLGPLWQVQDIYHGIIVMPQGVKRKKLKLKVPIQMKENGRSSCEDIFKVILTSQPTSFDMLELPTLGEQSISKKLDRSDQKAGGATEEWASMNFLFRTIIS